jgi:hypothetical protein
MELNAFLVRAKQHTYASGQPGKKLEDGSELFKYEEGAFRYQDRFLGGSAFIGQELVWQSGRLVWGMNYYGAVTAAAPEELGHFLKEALRQVPDDHPYRGPCALLRGNFEYLNETQGDLSSFTGVELILHAGTEVYRLAYHGGRLA